MGRLTLKEQEIGKAMRAAGPIAPSMMRRAVCQSYGGMVDHVNGYWLRWLRERVHPSVSLRAFARRLGFSVGYLCDIEHNRRKCTSDILKHYEAL